MQDKELLCDCDDIHSEVVNAAREKMQSEEILADLADFFKVFGDSTRIRILWALDAGEMCVCDMAELLQMTKSAISHQLNTLRKEKLVKSRRDGKNVIYSLEDDHVKSILEMGIEHLRERWMREEENHICP